MPPQIALIFVTVFVLFLLKLSRKQFPEVSNALSIPTVYMLIISTKPLAVWFGVGGVDMEAGSPLDRTVLFAIFCIGLIILSKKQFNWYHAIHENPWITLLIGYMLISTLWSDIPFSSFKRWIREVIALTMAFLLSTEKRPLYALQCLFTRIIYILIPFSVMLIKYYPHIGVTYGRWSGNLMWIGVTTQKNSLCTLCFFSFFFLVWTLMRRWRGHDIAATGYQIYVELFLLFLTAWLFLGPNHTPTYSATSTISLIVGLMAFLGFLWTRKFGGHFGVGASILIRLCIFSIILYGAVTPFIGKLSIVDISSTFGRDETLTDRTAIWAFLVPYALKKPVFGYGFGGFWTDEVRSHTSSHAHNGYLDTILNIGSFGLMLLTIFLIYCSMEAVKRMDEAFDWSVLWICLLIMTAVQNIAESTIISFGTQLMATLLFLAVCSKKHRNHRGNHGKY